MTVAIQSEAQLEAQLVARLKGLGWDPVKITDSAALEANLKVQLEAQNGTVFSGPEFHRILSHLGKGSPFEKAKSLRDRFQLMRDDGTSFWVEFFNTRDWCRNRYQVTSQVTQIGKYKTRYDVTLLVNGLPLVQIELKRRGMELKEAFNQINRYHKHSFWAGTALYQYVQIFVISNGVNTRYFANNRHQDFKQTFPWADVENRAINKLDAFADAFLEKCHISKMIAKYVVLHESDRVLMVLRPYQYHAVEAIVERVKGGRKNGYIWHTTGSGKTLTSFKAAQVVVENPKVEKVVFVVDRADLDYQTTKEFNHFSPGSIDGTDNTAALVTQLRDDTKVIVTTIQKLNTAISRDRYAGRLDAVKDKRIVFIFDECHRSQFGDTHKNIVAFFDRAQLFGFTGTPIFADNAVGRRTTKDLFGDCLHRYVITDAIRDDNVLKFSVEYWGKLKRKDGTMPTDEEVAGLNLREFYDHPDRIEGVVDWIIENHDKKTQKRLFASMLCVSSVEVLLRYYEVLKRKKAEGKHDLRVATVFTFTANEEDSDADGLIGEPDIGGEGGVVNPHTRDKLQACVDDYNAMFGTGHSVRDGKAFYAYYKNVAKRMKSRDRKDFQPSEGIDILLVVNMFLTGFDAKTLNTLYVDKNLRYHGLIQAFSRTNRILGQRKSQGNIVCFRNLKPKVDEAITLFSNKDARETILVEPYDDVVKEFNAVVQDLKKIAGKPDDVDGLASEDDILAFVTTFRKLIRLMNVLTSFAEFDPDDLEMTQQRFEDFKSKYLDIYDRTKSDDLAEKASIIDEIDFELELIRRDEINVAYILALLAAIANAPDEDEDAEETKKGKTKAVLDILGSEPRLRSKKDLIEEFMATYLVSRRSADELKEAFEAYWSGKKEEAFERICNEEGLDREAFSELMQTYTFSDKEPLADDVVATLRARPGIRDRARRVKQIIARMIGFIETYEENIGDLDAA
jgi:type I restriction enzyme R subunit